jgi:hypothetical protein
LIAIGAAELELTAEEVVAEAGETGHLYNALQAGSIGLQKHGTQPRILQSRSGTNSKATGHEGAEQIVGAEIAAEGVKNGWDWIEGRWWWVFAAALARNKSMQALGGTSTTGRLTGTRAARRQYLLFTTPAVHTHHAGQNADNDHKAKG